MHEVRVYFISQTIISEWLKGYTCENSNFNQKNTLFSVVVNNLHYSPMDKMVTIMGDPEIFRHKEFFINCSVA